MNAEQKRRAIAVRKAWADYEWSGPDGGPAEFEVVEIANAMAALLQELIDAPEPEPVAYATGYYAGCLSIATVDGRVLPAGTALYAAPPHQSEHHLEMGNTPAPSVPDGWKNAAEWLRNNYQDYPNISSLCEAMVAQSANNGSN